jgi:hypothetical protein
MIVDAFASNPFLGNIATITIVDESPTDRSFQAFIVRG